MAVRRGTLVWMTRLLSLLGQGESVTALQQLGYQARADVSTAKVGAWRFDGGRLYSCLLPDTKGCSPSLELRRL